MADPSRLYPILQLAAPTFGGVRPML